MVVTGRQCRYIVGIDEAGRGPLAGPLSVGAVAVAVNTRIEKLVSGITDSKLLSPEIREQIYNTLLVQQDVVLAHTFVRPETIDRYGLSYALQSGVDRALQKLKCDPRSTLVRLDGSLAAPQHFLYQETIVRGDLTEPLISAASIVAKVRRDRLMVSYARKFPAYGFERHKGYGTSAHRAILKKYGPCALHRRSFLRNIF